MSTPITHGSPAPAPKIAVQIGSALALLATAAFVVFTLLQTDTTAVTSADADSAPAPVEEIAPGTTSSAENDGCLWSGGGTAAGPDGIALNCVRPHYEPGPSGPR